MATVSLPAHCFDEDFEQWLKDHDITVEAFDPPWDYVFSGSRDNLELMVREHYEEVDLVEIKGE